MRFILTLKMTSFQKLLKISMLNVSMSMSEILTWSPELLLTNTSLCLVTSLDLQKISICLLSSRSRIISQQKSRFVNLWKQKQVLTWGLAFVPKVLQVSSELHNIRSVLLMHIISTEGISGLSHTHKGLYMTRSLEEQVTSSKFSFTFIFIFSVYIYNFLPGHSHSTFSRHFWLCFTEDLYCKTCLHYTT